MTIKHPTDGNGQRWRGRPVRNPFTDPAVEQHFYERAQQVVDLCYRPSAENTKKPFLLPNGLRMGKSPFWALVYLYYNKQFKVCLLEYVIDHLKLNLHVPPIPNAEMEALLAIPSLTTVTLADIVGDRTTIVKKVKMFEKIDVTSPIAPMLHQGDRFWEESSYVKYRAHYEMVVKLWKTADTPSAEVNTDTPPNDAPDTPNSKDEETFNAYYEYFTSTASDGTYSFS